MGKIPTDALYAASLHMLGSGQKKEVYDDLSGWYIFLRHLFDFNLFAYDGKIK